MKKHEKIGRVSTASVHKGTGRHWDAWILILNKAGAQGWTHSEIAKYLAAKHKLTPWWQQGVALAYEIATGKRIEGQNHKGEFGEVRTVKAGQRLRLSWRETDCPTKPTFIVLQHEGLKTSRQKEELRAYWIGRIECLSVLLSG